MKNILLKKIITACCILITFAVNGQQDHTAYVVTDSVRDGAKWNYLRTLDMRTGSYSNILLRFLDNNELLPSNTNSIVTCNGIAAIAYDKKNKRLYYTPMLTDQLAYVDLKTMKKVVVTNNFTGLMPKATDQSNIITRMVIADDETGYALTNDGRHLVRFRTKNNPAITDLGSLADAPGNNETSVHNGCSSFGGDIVADDDDNLYLFTFGKHVFKINIRTKVAKYIGAMKGLPANFSTSGAVVDKSGDKILLVSSVDATDVYALNIRTLVASRLNANKPWYSSDLSNGSVLKTKIRTKFSDELIVVDDETNSNQIALYPNPVTTKEFKIQFPVVTAGTYTISVMDAGGKSVLSKTAIMGGKTNVVSVNLPQTTGSGIYIVRVIDSNNKITYNGKVFVE